MQAKHLPDSMSFLPQSTMIGAQPDLHRGSSPLVTMRLLRALAEVADAHGWIAFAAISLVCGWSRLSGFASRHLGHDELYTFYIAQASTLKQLLVLTRTVDLHPPLSYLLVRTSFALFGVSSWSCRLPSVLAFLFTGVLVFWLAKRILSPLYGIVGTLFLWCATFTYQADEARPYSLMLFFTTLMLASWYQATAVDNLSVIPSDRRLALLTLTIGGVGLLLSHVLAVLPYAAFFAAELVRLSIRRKSDWALWIALSVPAISGLTYLPLIHTRSGVLFADDYHATPVRIFNSYWEPLRFVAIPLMLVVLVVCLWPVWHKPASQGQSQRTPSLPPPATLQPFGFLFLCFSLVPLAIGIVFAHTGTAFFDRYGTVFIIPIVFVPVLVLGFGTQRNQIAGVTVAIALSAVFFFNSSGKSWMIEQLGNFAPPRVARYVLNALALPALITEPMRPRVPPYLQQALENAPDVSDLDTIETDLPLVANTGLTFLEIDQQGDAKLTKRLYLLDDKRAAAAIAHDTVFKDYDRLKESFPIRGKVEPYCAFISEHPRFLAIGAYNHPQGWLLKKLDMDGADLRIIGSYHGVSEEAQLYEVTISKTACPAQP